MGRLGVLEGQSLWTSSDTAKADVIMMGTHGSYQGDQLFVTSGSGTTGEGAIAFDLLGVIKTTSNAALNPLQGLIIGFYADPGNKVGVLRGQFYGSSYPNLGMWESAEESGAAVIYRDQTLRGLTSPLNSPSDLPSRIVEGAVGGIGTNSTLYGTFGSQGSIYTPVGIVGRTYTIAGEPGWGIFRLVNALASTYTKPVGSGDAWSGTLFGDAVFGNTVPHPMVTIIIGISVSGMRM